MIKPGIDFKAEAKSWGLYFTTILCSIFIHELGHCMVAWINGFSAIPTPAKAYLTTSIPPHLMNYFSLGGILGSIIFTLTIFPVYLFSSYKFKSALLAGAIAMPAIYSLRLLLQGRGHDGTEFQQAQAALGFNYSGHFLDGLFLVLFILGTALWIFKGKPTYKIAGRLLLGAVLTVVFVVWVQNINNAIFDPLFRRD
ncbi:MAG: hypothetical protein DI535_09280 [Citrobacter freundii]|nr:MAG: hypothetical protein DI535_09280 [Citrobacter freundii]